MKYILKNLVGIHACMLASVSPVHAADAPAPSVRLPHARISNLCNESK